MNGIKKEDEGKIMALHYIDGIDFPLFHEPPYPIKNGKKKVASNDQRGKQFVHRDAQFKSHRQHQRG